MKEVRTVSAGDTLQLRYALRPRGGDDIISNFEDAEPETITLGDGTVDFVGCFKTLHGLGYAGPFLVEMWTEKAADPLLEIRKAREWVAERLRAGGYA